MICEVGHAMKYSYSLHTSAQLRSGSSTTGVTGTSVSAGSRTDKVQVWHVMESLPVANDVDQTLPMNLDGAGAEIPSAVGQLLVQEDAELAKQLQESEGVSKPTSPEKESSVKAGFGRTCANM